MSNQIVKSVMMLTLVVGLVLSAAVVSANGQSASLFIAADVPFDFIVADKTLPSGKYSVRMASSNGVTINSRDGGFAATRLSNAAVGRNNKKARMVFHRYGQQYFLAEVWSTGTYGRQLLQCKSERKVRHEQELASNSANASYEIVEVVASLR